MYISKNVMLLLAAVAVFAAATVAAQQPAPAQPNVRANPAPNCTTTPAQEEANLQLVMNPVGNPNDRIDPSYKQNNPAFIKGAREAGMTDYAYFMSRFGGAGGRQGGGAAAGRAAGAGGAAAGAAGGRAGAPAGAAAAPQPPPGNGNEIVVAQCDIVVVIHMNNRQDPTAPPGTFYRAFTFDAWRVKDGKIVEHWDTAVINPPAPPPAAAPAQ